MSILGIKINKININDMINKPKCILIYGNSHKIVNHILSKTPNKKVILLMENDININDSLVSFIPKKNITNSSIISINYNKKLLENIISNKIDNHLNEEKYIILNNILDNESYKDDTISKLFCNCRIHKLIPLFISNNIFMLPPRYRNNIDYIILSHNLTSNIIIDIYNKFYLNKLFKELYIFQNLYNEVKIKNMYMIIDIYLLYKLSNELIKINDYIKLYEI